MTDILYRQLGLPVFQNKVYPSAESARGAVIGDVELVQCPQTGLVSNRMFEPALLEYDQDYQNEQACSTAFRDHLQAVLKIILGNCSTDDRGIEIGCGKGTFLEMLNGAGANATGYDPAYEGSDPRVIKEYFGARDVPAPDYLILRHVLEHIGDPWSFLKQLTGKCKSTTKIYIEVPCFEWIVGNDAFYDVFYEHVNYFTLDVLKNAFSRVFASGKLFGDQYIYLIAELASFRFPNHYDGPLFSPLNLSAYLDQLMSLRADIYPGNLYVWGAGAKGITFSNIVSKSGIQVSALVDINPAKQGRYAGFSGIPILAPSKALPKLDGADVYVMNPVYLDEIKAMSGSRTINWISVTPQ